MAIKHVNTFQEVLPEPKNSSTALIFIGSWLAKMITITQDSELMTNLISANPIPAGNRFIAFRDHNLDPAVFSLSDDQKLNLVITVNGEPNLIDFGNTSGLYTKHTKIQAFDVKQAPDSGLNICIATEAIDGRSDFYLIHDIKPSELLKPVAADRIVKGSGFPGTHHIFMVSISLFHPSHQMLARKR